MKIILVQRHASRLEDFAWGWACVAALYYFLWLTCDFWLEWIQMVLDALR